MKSHMIDEGKNDIKLEECMKYHLQRQFNIGASYGAKAFCQVIKDKINNFNGDDREGLLKDISDFADKTLSNSPEDIQNAFAKMNDRISKMIGKDIGNAE